MPPQKIVDSLAGVVGIDGHFSNPLCDRSLTHWRC
jgi:hypothetical protein